MNEDSSRLPEKHGLKNEWSLLVHSFIESSDQEKETVLEKIKSLGLTKVDLKTHAKTFSQTRKNLNLCIEKIKTEIDRLSAVTVNLELVGSDTESIQQQIEKLNSEGETLSLDVSDVEKKIKKIREIEDAMTSLDYSVL
jgi:uncharacterized coiled-coil DUF342 family protein